MASYGQTIQIYYPTGDTTGLRIANIPTRTVQVFDIPRSLLHEFFSLPESSQPAIYFLFGGGNDEKQEAYIGQTGNIGKRLTEHKKGKDFWERAVVAVSLTSGWTQTHINYLEWDSIRLANLADRYDMSNGDNGNTPFISDPLKADCREYMDTIKQLLSTLGYPILNKPKRGSDEPNGADQQNNGVTVYLQARQADAKGVYSSEGLLVLAGSVGRIITGSNKPHIQDKEAKIRELEAAKVIEVNADGKSYTFKKDHLFPTPSGASSLLTCSSSSGRREFRNADRQSIAEFEN